MRGNLVLVLLCVSLAITFPRCVGFPEENSQEEGIQVEKRRMPSSKQHRQKRLFWITNDGRIALPPGTVMTITPTLALPFVRYPPHGFLSNMSISLPFTVDFDKLGLTDNENPYGVLPGAFDARSGTGQYKSNDARKAGVLMADLVAAFLKARSRKRDVAEDLAIRLYQAFRGGERAILYGTTEEILATFGLNGRACLLRAICEVHGHPLHNFGLIGEILKLFLTPSKSPFAELLQEYVQAEERGKFHGECWPYFKDCPKSLFLPSSANRYTKDALGDAVRDDNRHQNHDQDSQADINGGNGHNQEAGPGGIFFTAASSNQVSSLNIAGPSQRPAM